MESIQLTAIKRQVAFLDSIGAVFNIEFDGQRFASSKQKSSRGARKPWAETGIRERIQGLKVGQEINIPCTEFATVSMMISYCSSACCAAFGSGACICATGSDNKSINVLRVF